VVFNDDIVAKIEQQEQVSHLQSVKKKFVLLFIVFLL